MVTELPAEISAEAYRALLAAEGKRAHKYGAVAVTTADGRFDSTGEAERWEELKLLQRLGAIRDLARQVPYTLTVNDVQVAKYKADFVYTEEGRVIVEDWKPGVLTEGYRIKRALMRACHGISIRETGR